MGKNARSLEDTNARKPNPESAIEQEQAVASGAPDAAGEVETSPGNSAGSEETNCGSALADTDGSVPPATDGKPPSSKAEQGGDLKLPVDVLAAAAAAAMVYGTHEHDTTGLPVARYDFLGPKPIAEVALCAAEFVRANCDAQAATIPVHLKLNRLRPDETFSPRELAAWKVFREALLALDEMRATEAAEREKAQREAAPPRKPAVAPEDLAFRVRDQPFAPTAFTGR